MAQQTINNGTIAGDGTGENLFNAFTKVNANFTDLYTNKEDTGTAASAVAAHVAALDPHTQYLTSAEGNAAYDAIGTAAAAVVTHVGLADPHSQYALESSLGDAAGKNVGTTAGTVAAGDHNHTGVYEPADATILKSANIGSTVQGYDVDTAKLDVVQSWTAQQTFKELKDTVHTITDGAAFEIDPGNGSVQVVTLGASRTPAATNFEAGQVVLLGIDDGSAFTITWTTVNPTWVKPGGTASAPTLATSGYTWVLLWKVGTTIYASEVGKP